MPTPRLRLRLHVTFACLLKQQKAEAESHQPWHVWAVSYAIYFGGTSGRKTQSRSQSSRYLSGLSVPRTCCTVLGSWQLAVGSRQSTSCWRHITHVCSKNQTCATVPQPWLGARPIRRNGETKAKSKAKSTTMLHVLWLPARYRTIFGMMAATFHDFLYVFLAKSTRTQRNRQRHWYW